MSVRRDASQQDTAEIQKQEAKALALTGVAVLATSYVALGCLLPMFALLFITVALVYGAGDAVLLIAAIVALLVIVIVTARRRSQR